MSFYDEQLDAGQVIESDKHRLERVEQPSHAQGLEHAWSNLIER